MKALVVSRLSLGKIYEGLRKKGVKDFIDFYERKDGWKDENDIIEVIEKEKCDTVVIISNIWLALKLMAKAKLNTVFVVIPQTAGINEIYKAKIYTITVNEIIMAEYEG